MHILKCMGHNHPIDFQASYTVKFFIYRIGMKLKREK